MNKINFKNLPDTSTPLSAENLNLLQDNVEDAIDNVSIDLDSQVSTTSTNGVENQAITNYVDDKILDTYSTSNTSTYSCDYINNNSGGTDTYSITETLTNKIWIDNRPIYRKVLTYNSPFIQRQTLSFSSITNFNEYTKIEGLLYRSDGYTLPLPIGNVNDDWTSVLYDFDSSSFGLYIGNDLLTTASKIVVIIEYTKTTD